VPNKDALEWARICRLEAAKATLPNTKAFLLELAAEYEEIAGQIVQIDFDDPWLQDAVASRLSALAAKRKAWMSRES